MPLTTRCVAGFAFACGLVLLSSLLTAAQPVEKKPKGPQPLPFESKVTIRQEDNYRLIEANGIPGHQVGWFPNPGNPNAIRPQQHHFRVRAHPQVADQPTPIGFWQFGVAVNGVPFDPAGPFWKGDQASGWEFEVLCPSVREHLGIDLNHAHVQKGGAYHYHGLPTGLVWQLTVAAGGSPRMLLLGYAADGFPIYGPLAPENPQDPGSGVKRLRSSYRLRNGERGSGPGGKYDGTFVQDYEYVAGLGDLDECNGRRGRTPEYPGGIYHYVVTDDFPFIPRLYRGQPDPSFRHPGAGPGLGAVPPGLRDYPARK